MATLKILVPALADFHKRFEESFRSIQAFRRELQESCAVTAGLEARIREQTGVAQEFRQIGDATKPLIDTLQKIAKIERRERALDDAGWLPHHTMTLEIVEDNMDNTGALSGALEHYYRNQWPLVRKEIEKALLTYSLDEESSATFKESLQAHQYGLFRCVPCVLFPAIERLARKELFGNKIAQFITSLKDLQDSAGLLCPGQLQPKAYYGMVLYRRLIGHFYAYVTDEATRSRFVQDRIPNRHAVLHGLDRKIHQELAGADQAVGIV